MRRRIALVLAATMVAAGVAAGPSETGASIHADDPCGDGGVAAGFGPTSVGPHDASATDLAAFDAVQVRDADGRSIGIDLTIEVCGEAKDGEEHEQLINVSWATTEDAECVVDLDIGTNIWFLRGVEHDSMTYACRIELPERLPQWTQLPAIDDRESVSVPIDVTVVGSRYLVSLRESELAHLGELVAPGQTLWNLEVHGMTRYSSYDELEVGDLTMED